MHQLKQVFNKRFAISALCSLSQMRTTGKIYVSYLREKSASHGFVKESEFTSFYKPRNVDKHLKNFAEAKSEIDMKRYVIGV